MTTVITLALLATISLGYWLYRSGHTVYRLNAQYTTSEPVLDGKGSDPVWKETQAVTIPIKNDDPVILKTVHTKDEVFFLARYKDSSHDYIDVPWIYDGTKWDQGRISDQFAFFFEFDDSIKDFRSKGFEVMDYGFKWKDKLWEFGIRGAKDSKGVWPGAYAKADVWMMHSAISSPFGQGDDGIFQVNPQYLNSPTTLQPVLYVQWDGGGTDSMLSLNTNRWQGSNRGFLGEQNGDNLAEVPYLMYKPGLNIKNTPYPFTDQLVPIDSGTVWKKGAQLPYVYFNRELQGRWGGSRDDIQGKMTWSNGYWTVEMGRKKNTGNLDDLVFKDGQSNIINFGVLIRRDGGLIRYSPPARLELIPPVRPPSLKKG